MMYRYFKKNIFSDVFKGVKKIKKIERQKIYFKTCICLVMYFKKNIFFRRF